MRGILSASPGAGRVAAAVALLAVVLTSCSREPSPSASGAPVLFPYMYKTVDGQAFHAEWGRLTVPENRERRDSRSIELAFVRLKSTAKQPTAPILLVSGGPGISGIDAPRDDWSMLLKPLLDVADVIAFDQRGVGSSRPALDCGKPLDLPLDVPVTRDMYLQAYLEQSRACTAYWKGQGVDLAAYHTEASADDIDALREAPRIDTLTLFGSSYGSHLIFSTIRRHGDRIERAVVMGPEGPDHTVKLPSNIQKELERIGQAVAKDAVLGRAIPDFAGLVRTVLARLDQAPVVAETTEPKTQRTVKITLGSFDLRIVTAQGLGSSSFIRQLPAAYYDMANGDFSWLAAQALAWRRQPARSAMSEQVDCASGVSDERAARIRNEIPLTLLGDLADYPGLEACAAAERHDLGPGFRSPLTSNVPLLFVTGTLDGRTPPSNAEEMLPGLPNGHHIIVEFGTHSTRENIFTLAATREATIGFLKGGSVTLTSASLPPLEFARPVTLGAAPPKTAR
ncbi:MAG: alpha/beta fold hydrolase [Planctomycetes bacterium]|nr:alpha/beta fold hydrolase [Planctomycetota bacterium]